MITSEIIKTAKRIRKAAAIKYRCCVKDIVWSSCLSMAIKRERVTFDNLLKDKRLSEKFNQFMNVGVWSRVNITFTTKQSKKLFSLGLVRESEFGYGHIDVLWDEDSVTNTIEQYKLA